LTNVTLLVSNITCQGGGRDRSGGKALASSSSFYHCSLHSDCETDRLNYFILRTDVQAGMERSELVGFGEVIDLLGVPHSTAARYMKRPDFPPPFQRLSSGRVWRRTDVERWASENLPIRRGRPRAGRSRG
jgi:predicted DNA-binding transcriptional regulator AlpA